MSENSDKEQILAMLNLQIKQFTQLVAEAQVSTAAIIASLICKRIVTVDEFESLQKEIRSKAKTQFPELFDTSLATSSKSEHNPLNKSES